MSNEDHPETLVEPVRLVLTLEERKRIFDDGKAAAANGGRGDCPYLNDETPERVYIWLGGYHSQRDGT